MEQRFNVSLDVAPTISLVNASETGFRLKFAAEHSEPIKFNKFGLISIGLRLPPQGMVTVKVRPVWVSLSDRTVGFEIVHNHPAYIDFIRSQKSIEEAS